MFNHNSIPLLQVSELCSSFSNNCGGEVLYLDTTNIRRPTFKSSISKLTQSYATTKGIKPPFNYG